MLIKESVYRKEILFILIESEIYTFLVLPHFSVFGVDQTEMGCGETP